MIMRWLSRTAVAGAALLWLSIFFVRGGNVGLITGAVVFLLIWWVLVFTMLPIGVRSQEETGEIVPGSEPGAPERPNMARKMWWTTSITSAIWIVYFIVIQSGILARFTPHGGHW